MLTLEQVAAGVDPEDVGGIGDDEVAAYAKALESGASIEEAWAIAQGG